MHQSNKKMTIQSLTALAGMFSLCVLASPANAQYVLVGNCFRPSVDIYTEQGEFVANYISNSASYTFSCVTDIRYGANNSNLYVLDYGRNSVVEFDQYGNFLRVVSDDVHTGTGHVVVGDDIYVASREVDGMGGLIKVNIPSGTTTLLAKVRGAAGVILANNGNLLVSSGGTGPGQGDDNIQEFTTDGTFVGDFITSGSGGLTVPQSLQYHNGNLFVVSCGNDKILEYDGVNGTFIGEFAQIGVGAEPTGLLFNPDGTLLVSNKFANGLSLFDSSGNFLEFNAGNGGATDNILAFRGTAVPEPGALPLLLSSVGIGISAGIFRKVMRRR